MESLLKRYTTEFVDRVEDLKYLEHFYADAQKSEGRTLLIFGESGIGKTRLIAELLSKVASASGEKLTILMADCMSIGSRPYGLFLDAWRKLADESELVIRRESKTTTLTECFVSALNGILLSHVYEKESITDKDKDVFMGMFTAVNDFVKDSFGGKDAAGKLGGLEYGDSRIFIEHGKYAWLAAVSTAETPELRNDLRAMMNTVDASYGSVLERWDGDLDAVGGIQDITKVLLGKSYKVERRLEPAEVEAEKIKIYERFLQAVTKEAQKNPVVIFLDNLQWADDTSYGLLHYIARNTRELPVLLIGTYRPEDISEKHPLSALLRAMRKEELYEARELNRLGQDDVEALIRSLYPQLECSGAFVSRIYEETEGNPFFVEAMVKALESENVIWRSHGVWKTKDIEKVVLPGSIKDAVLMRVHKLTDVQQKLLSIGAVIGEKFNYDVLRDVAELDEGELADELDALMTAKLLHEMEEKDALFYAFDHGKICDVLYDKLSAVKRRALHRQVASAYEKVYAKSLDAVSKELATHYYRATVYDKALEFARRGGEHALSSNAPKDASECYQLALDALAHLEQTDETKKIELELTNRLGYANFILGDWDKALELAERSLALSSELMNYRQMCESYKNVAEIYVARGEYAAAEETLKKASSLAENINDVHTLGECHYWLGKMYWFSGDLKKASQALGKALGIAEQINDLSLRAKALMDKGVVHWYRGEYDTALELQLKSLQISEKLGDKYEVARAYNNIGGAYSLGYKNYAKALEYYEQQIKLCEEIGYPRDLAYGYSNAGEDYAQIDETEKALDYTNKAFELFKKLGEKRMLGACHCNYGIIYTKTKDYDSAREHFERAVKIAKELNSLETLSQIYYWFGMMYKAQGDKASARAQFENAIAVYEEMGNEERVEACGKEMAELRDEV